MKEIDPEFTASKEVAFRKFGARPPIRQWSSFDVEMPAALKGEATRLVITVAHVKKESDHEPRGPSVFRDTATDSLWYRVPSPGERNTEKAHWKRVNLARDTGLPIIGILTNADTGKCSLDHIFDVGEMRDALDGSGIWLELLQRGDVGCEVGEVEIHGVTAPGGHVPSLTDINQRLAEHVAQAMASTADERHAATRGRPEGSSPAQSRHVPLRTQP